MMVIDWPPHPSHPTQSARGYILNVFVEPDHRGRGLARALMDLAMEEARQRGLDHMILHATPMGRPLYEPLGWAQTSEMGLGLRLRVGGVADWGQVLGLEVTLIEHLDAPAGHTDLS